jgi:hypothetical protein
MGDGSLPPFNSYGKFAKLTSNQFKVQIWLR